LVGSKSEESASFDVSAAPESQLAQYVEVEGEADGLFKSINRVAITQFQIEFMTATSANAFAKSGYGSSSRYASGELTLNWRS